MNTEHDEVLTKNGFTFRRKRKEYEEIPEPKKLKKGEISKPQPGEENIPVVLREINRDTKKEKEPQVKSILKEGKFTLKNEEETKTNGNFEYKKIKTIDTKEASKLAKEYFSKPIGKENAPPTEKVEIKEIKKPNKLPKLPAYPTSFNPVDFDLDEYEKIDPFKRLEKMVADLNLNEKTVLQKEYKDYPIFLSMIDKFAEKLQSETARHIEVRVGERSKANKVVKENLQNIFEKQKGLVIKELMNTYQQELKSLESFQEQMIEGGKAETIAKGFLKNLEHSNRLNLDVNLAKKVDSQREEIEKEVIVKVKKSLANIYENEALLSNIQKEVRSLEKTLDRQTRQAHDKIFAEYIPFFEADPAELINDFLSE